MLRLRVRKMDELRSKGGVDFQSSFSVYSYRWTRSPKALRIWVDWSSDLMRLRDRETASSLRVHTAFGSFLLEVISWATTLPVGERAHVAHLVCAKACASDIVNFVTAPFGFHSHSPTTAGGAGVQSNHAFILLPFLVDKLEIYPKLQLFPPVWYLRTFKMKVVILEVILSAWNETNASLSITEVCSNARWFVAKKQSVAHTSRIRRFLPRWCGAVWTSLQVGALAVFVLSQNRSRQPENSGRQFCCDETHFSAIP